MIHWELYKKLKFDHTNKNGKCTTQNLNETHKLPWDFEIQTNHQISARRPDLIIINKKKRTCRIVDFAVPADHRVKLKEWEKKDKYLDLTGELKKMRNMKVTIVQIVIGALGTVTKGLVHGLEGLEIRGQVETIQTSVLFRSARILRRVLEDLGRLVVTETLLRNHQLTLEWKTLKREQIIIIMIIIIIIIILGS